MTSQLYNLIKNWYKLLEKQMLNNTSLELQFWAREHLKETIRLYRYYKGKANISKFLKYYV